MRPPAAGPGPNEGALGEPAIAQVACDGTTIVTRFRVPDPTYSGAGPVPDAPGDRGGFVSAIAANAPNDAWAATSYGELLDAEYTNALYRQPPRIYRLTNGEPPAAPEGDDAEQRPLELQLDAPILELEPPPPPPPPPPPATVSESKKVVLPPAVYGVKAHLHGRRKLSLYLTFKLRRPVILGAQALRHKRVVGVARTQHFTGRAGLLVIRLNRKHWPTSVRFVMPAQGTASALAPVPMPPLDALPRL
jgi:hypothetical protein